MAGYDCSKSNEGDVCLFNQLICCCYFIFLDVNESVLLSRYIVASVAVMHLVRSLHYNTGCTRLVALMIDSSDEFDWLQDQSLTARTRYCKVDVAGVHAARVPAFANGRYYPDVSSLFKL